MAHLLNYFRYPVSSKLYDPRLAYSMHLAISEDGKNFEALNHNDGVPRLDMTEELDVNPAEPLRIGGTIT